MLSAWKKSVENSVRILNPIYLIVQYTEADKYRTGE